jgi:hypothetical protein
VYRVVIYPEAADQIAELPPHLLRDYALVIDAVRAAPWESASHNPQNPGAEVRRRLFGPLGVGQILYLVLEREREVHVLYVVWLELSD